MLPGAPLPNFTYRKASSGPPESARASLPLHCHDHRLLQGRRTARLTRHLEQTYQTPPVTCPSPAGYVVSWEVPGKDWPRETRTLQNSTHEYKVTGLTSLTTYILEVAAMTNAGTGTITSSTISSGVPPGEIARHTAIPGFAPGSA